MPPWGDLLIDPSTPMTVALLGWIPSALGPLAVPIEIPLDSGLSGIQVAVQVFAGTLLGEATLLTIP
jgi:hypothetical protein